MANIVAMLRSAQALSDDELVVLIEKLSTSAKEELVSAFDDVPKPKFECAICQKKFDRKWNRDRHVRKHEKTVGDMDCPFVTCNGDDAGPMFGSALLLVEHLVTTHGLETKSSKRPRTGVRHDDHYDLLLPSGALLHVGESGIEERALERSPEEAPLVGHHHHAFAESVGQPVQHDDHMDVLVGDELHCLNASCTLLDVMDVADGSEWDELLKLFDQTAPQ
jgi:hypothetical protein